MGDCYQHGQPIDKHNVCAEGHIPVLLDDDFRECTESSLHLDQAPLCCLSFLCPQICPKINSAALMSALVTGQFGIMFPLTIQTMSLVLGHPSMISSSHALTAHR